MIFHKLNHSSQEILYHCLILICNCYRYPRDYVHRVGRTARAGRGGLAVSFVTEVSNSLMSDFIVKL